MQQLSQMSRARRRFPTTSRRSSATLATPAAPKTDLKAIEVPETCDQCGGKMVVRPGRRGFFLGCAGYPKCKGTKEPSEATLEKIMAVTGA